MVSWCPTANYEPRRGAELVGGCAACFGKFPMLTFLDIMPMTKEKMIAA